jgi:hypothetical protein
MTLRLAAFVLFCSVALRAAEIKGTVKNVAGGDAVNLIHGRNGCVPRPPAGHVAGQADGRKVEAIVLCSTTWLLYDETATPRGSNSM